MRWAILDDNYEIDAWVIEEARRHLYRGRITCPGLACPLRWRKRSSDGKAPTFYGEHRNGCDFKEESDEQPAVREIEEVNTVINTCEEMQIRLDAYSGQRASHDSGALSTSGTSKRHLPGAQEDTRRRGTTGLRPLLRKLIASPSFRENPMPLVLSDGTRTSVKDGCIEARNYQLTNQTRIVWGKIKSVSGSWLNSGFKSQKMPAVLLRKGVESEAVERAGAQRLTDLSGWYFIVEGQFELTSQDGPYVSLRDVSRIAFLPASP